jgi:hypothetical protein
MAKIEVNTITCGAIDIAPGDSVKVHGREYRCREGWGEKEACCNECSLSLRSENRCKTDDICFALACNSSTRKDGRTVYWERV